MTCVICGQSFAAPAFGHAHTLAITPPQAHSRHETDEQPADVSQEVRP